MGAVVHSHQSLLVIDARQRYDNRRVGDDQIQVAFGEVKVDRLKAKCKCGQFLETAQSEAVNKVELHDDQIIIDGFSVKHPKSKRCQFNCDHKNSLTI